MECIKDFSLLSKVNDSFVKCFEQFASVMLLACFFNLFNKLIGFQDKHIGLSCKILNLKLTYHLLIIWKVYNHVIVMLWCTKSWFYFEYNELRIIFKVLKCLQNLIGTMYCKFSTQTISNILPSFIRVFFFHFFNI